MRGAWVWITIVAAVVSTGCATYLDVQRRQAALVEVYGPQPGVGILAVHADDDVLARAPNDFSNMTGLVVKVAKEYFAQQETSMVVKDFTDLGYQPRWTHRKHDPRQWEVEALEGIPAGAHTPLVTVIKVVDWRTTSETVEKVSREVARVSLLMSTWTQEGDPIRTELVSAVAVARASGVVIKTYPEAAPLLGWYRRTDGYHAGSLPDDRTLLFWEALRNAVALHYFPLFPHRVNERFVVVDDERSREGLLQAQSGQYDQALAAWMKVAESDPKAHGALYNAALVHLMRGDDGKAAELLSKAVAVEERWLYTSLLASVNERLAMRRQVGSPPSKDSAP